MENQYSTEKDEERIDPKKIFETPSSVFSVPETNKLSSNEFEDSSSNLKNRKIEDNKKLEEKQTPQNQFKFNNSLKKPSTNNFSNKKNLAKDKSSIGSDITQKKEGIKKVNFIEYFLWIFVLLIIDIISFILDFFDVGAIFGPTIQNISMAIVSGWFYLFKQSSESTKLERMIVKFLINYIPWIPTLVFIFIIEAYLHNHPKIKSKVELAAGKKGISTKTV